MLPQELKEMVHVERLLWTGCLISCSYYYYSILLLFHSFPIMPVDPFMGCFAGQMKEGQDRGSWIVMFGAFCPIRVTHKPNWFWENSQKIIWKKNAFRVSLCCLNSCWEKSVKLANMNENHSKFFKEPSKGSPAEQPLWQSSLLLNITGITFNW